MKLLLVIHNSNQSKYRKNNVTIQQATSIKKYLIYCSTIENK
ncbi:hypothetical protein SLGD_01243 [Staphylococcus lugdunensis HKU09-01]|nr:hypothetical protein SLGD_01243 [Staphylococcus lugdunensis HKU09-01]